MIFICNWLREIAVTNEKTKKQQGKNFQNCPPLEETLFFFGLDESLAAGLKREMTWSGLSAAQVVQKAKVKESDIQRVLATGRAHPNILIDVFRVFYIQLVSVPSEWK